MPPKNKQKKGLEITLQVGDMFKRKSPFPKAKQGKQKKKKKPLGTKVGPGRKDKKGVPHGVDDDTIFLKKGGPVSGLKGRKMGRGLGRSATTKKRPKKPAKTRYSTDIVDDDLKNIPKFLDTIRKRGIILSEQMKKDRMPIYRKEGGSASKFPDLSGDGKVTKKDILIGRGVIKKRKGGSVTGRSIGPAGASIVSDDGKRIKKLKKMGQSIAQSIAGSAFGGVGKLAGRLAKRGYGKARK